MALGKSKLMIFLVTMVLCDDCFGSAVYKVGDSDGWTSRGHVDYNKWASTKDFYVGDTLIFVYSNQFHSVMQVTDQDFQSCNTTSPIAAYTSGSDTITLKRPGHFFFLCGTPGHCQVGQKIDVKVTLPIPNTSFATPSPSSSPSSSHSEAPSLILSSASTLVLHSSKFGLAVTTFVLCLLISILEIF